jgi:hypothetical protein
MTAAAIVGIAAVFLLLAGDRISHRIQASRTPDRLAWIDDRIRTQPERRAAWRSLKKLMTEGDL